MDVKTQGKGQKFGEKPTSKKPRAQYLGTCVYITPGPTARVVTTLQCFRHTRYYTHLPEKMKNDVVHISSDDNSRLCSNADLVSNRFFLQQRITTNIYNRRKIPDQDAKITFTTQNQE